MAAGATPHTTPHRYSGPELLYVLGERRENQIKDEQAARSLHQQSKRKRLVLTSDEAARCPQLAAHLATHDGWPPSITRSYAARTRHLNAIYAAHGPLVLLRYHLDELNEYPLRSPDLPTEARPLIKESAGELLLPSTPYTVDIQRGSLGRTHWHPVAPLTGLLPEHAALVSAAKHGKRGGCELLDGLAYGVVIRPAPENRSRVARYNHPPP